MPTESQLTGRLLRELRRRLPDAVIYKHNDRSTAAIPDCSVTLRCQTHWFEMKIAPNIPTKLQQYYLDRLGKIAHVVTFGKLGHFVMDGELYDFKEGVEAIAALFK